MGAYTLPPRWKPGRLVKIPNGAILEILRVDLEVPPECDMVTARYRGSYGATIRLSKSACVLCDADGNTI